MRIKVTYLGKTQPFNRQTRILSYDGSLIWKESFNPSRDEHKSLWNAFLLRKKVLERDGGYKIDEFFMIGNAIICRWDHLIEYMEEDVS